MEVGWILYEAGRSRQAEDLAKATTTLLSGNITKPEEAFIKGSGLALLAHCAWPKDSESAAELARSAVQLLIKAAEEGSHFDGATASYCIAARLYLLLDQPADALMLLEKCLQQELSESDRLTCLGLRAEGLRLQNRFEEAAEVLDEALDYAGEDKRDLVNICYQLGLTQRFLNRLKEAEKNFQKALSALTTRPGSYVNAELIAEIHWNLAAVYYDLGAHDTAATEYKQVIRNCGKNGALRANALFWLGHCLFVMGKYKEARESYSEFLALPLSTLEQLAEAQEGIAKTFYNSGDYEQAKLEFQKVLSYYPETDPYHYTVLLSLANCYEGTEDYRATRTYLEKVLASPQAPETDKSYARKALIENLAKLYYQSSRYVEAAAAFEEGLVDYSNDDPRRPHIVLWLGTCYEGSRDFAKARKCFEEVLASPHGSESDKNSAKEGLRRLPSS